jgi:hypothetical protein
MVHALPLIPAGSGFLMVDILADTARRPLPFFAQFQ